MAGLLRNLSAKILPASQSQLSSRRIPATFVPVRCMASSKLFIGGLSFATDEAALKDAFSAHGQVLEVKIVLDRNTGMSRGFAFLTFNTESEADAAFKAMNGRVVNGRIIRVDYALNKPMGGAGFQRRSDVYYPGGGGGRFGQDSGPSRVDAGGGGFQQRSDAYYPSGGGRLGQDFGPTHSDSGVGGFQPRSGAYYPSGGGRLAPDSLPNYADAGSGGAFQRTPDVYPSGGGGRIGQDPLPNYADAGSGGAFQRMPDAYPSGGGRIGQDFGRSQSASVGGGFQPASASYPGSGASYPGSGASYPGSGASYPGDVGRFGGEHTPSHSVSGGFQSGSKQMVPPGGEDIAQGRSGWSQASPAAEDFGPESAKVGLGPKSLQGGYEYKPRHQVAGNTPLAASAGAVANNSLGISDDTASAYPKGTAGPISDNVRHAYAGSSPGPSSDVHGLAYPKAGSGIPYGADPAKFSPGVRDSTVAAPLRSAPTMSGVPPVSKSSTTDVGGLSYPKSSPSYGGLPGYPDKNIGIDLTSDIGLGYPKSSPYSVGSSYLNSSPGFSGSSSSANSDADPSKEKVTAPHEEDPKFPGAYVDKYYDPNRKSFFADNTTPVYAKSSTLPAALAYKRANPGLSVNTTPPAASKNSTGFTAGTDDGEKNKLGLSESTVPPTTVPVESANDVGGDSSSVDGNTSDHKIESSSSSYTDASGQDGSRNSEVEPKYAEGGL